MSSDAETGRVPSLVEQQNERLRLALEMIFREVVFNLFACSKDEAATMRWAQRRAESIFLNKQDADEEDALREAQA